MTHSDDSHQHHSRNARFFDDIHSSLKQTTAPTADPVSVSAAKAHARIEHTAEDTQVQGWVRDAVAWLEEQTETQLVVATWQLKMDHFPTADNPVELRIAPVLSVSSIVYVATDGTSTTWASSDYQVDTQSQPALVRPAYGETYPTTRDQQNAVTVTFVAGYLTPFTVNTSTDVITLSGRNPTDDDVERLSTTDGDLPGGLSEQTDYYVISSSGATCKLSTSSGGSAVDITDSGTGTHFLGTLPHGFRTAIYQLVGHWDVHREATSMERVSPVAYSLESLVKSAKWRVGIR